MNAATLVKGAFTDLKCSGLPCAPAPSHMPISKTCIQNPDVRIPVCFKCGVKHTGENFPCEFTHYFGNMERAMMSQNDGVPVGLTMSRYRFALDTENIDSPPPPMQGRVGTSPGVPAALSFR